MKKRFRKNLILLRGLPGAGKTTVAQFFISIPTEAEVVSADDYFIDESGEYNFDPTELHKAHSECLYSVDIFMEDEVEMIVVHNTFTKESELKPYFELAEKYGYNVHSLIVENRHGNESIHDVPEETIDKMENRFSIKLNGK